MDTLAPFLEESSLRVISILEDEFGDVGWNALLDMLKKNNRLYEVNAELSNYSDEIGKKLIEKLNWMLEANRVLYNCSLVDELFDYVDDSNKYKEIQMQLSRNKWHTVRELYIGFRCADSNLFCFPIELIHYIASLTCKKEVFVPMYTRAIAGI
jgi:hypothetical protein